MYLLIARTALVTEHGNVAGRDLEMVGERCDWARPPIPAGLPSGLLPDSQSSVRKGADFFVVYLIALVPDDPDLLDFVPSSNPTLSYSQRIGATMQRKRLAMVFLLLLMNAALGFADDTTPRAFAPVQGGFVTQDEDVLPYAPDRLLVQLTPDGLNRSRLESLTRRGAQAPGAATGLASLDGLAAAAGVRAVERPYDAPRNASSPASSASTAGSCSASHRDRTWPISRAASPPTPPSRPSPSTGAPSRRRSRPTPSTRTTGATTTPPSCPAWTGAAPTSTPCPPPSARPASTPTPRRRGTARRVTAAPA